MWPELPLSRLVLTAVLEFGLRKSLWTWQWPNWPRVAHSPGYGIALQNKGKGFQGPPANCPLSVTVA